LIAVLINVGLDVFRSASTSRFGLAADIADLAIAIAPEALRDWHY